MLKEKDSWQMREDGWIEGTTETHLEAALTFETNHLQFMEVTSVYILWEIKQINQMDIFC